MPIMELEYQYDTIERARNAAIKWLENQGAVFGPHRRIAIGRLGVLEGKEVGISSTQKPFWRIRLDYDPDKGPHFNVEFGEGTRRKKAAFKFPGTEDTIAQLGQSRRPRQ
jgi:hypothetical protein